MEKNLNTPPTRNFFLTVTLTLFVIFVLSGCSQFALTQQPSSMPAVVPTLALSGPTSFAPPSRPKLVVVISVDQMRADYLTRFNDHLGDGGFKRLLHEGASWTGQLQHYATYTGPGHALMLSGSYPYTNGISTNKWFNYETNRSEAMVFDPNNQILGTKKTKTGDDVSPANFNGSTVGDELHLATGGLSKTIGLATKGRGAILMSGRLADVYWMNPANAEMTTSTYYKEQLPDWVIEFNQRRIPESYFGGTWNRLKGLDAYATVVDDDSIAELGPYGLETTFPHIINGGLETVGPDYYKAFMLSPFVNEHQFEFAKAAINGEQLGQRGVTDLLAISISSTDLVGHDFGPFSHEMTDLLYRLDEQLAEFLTWLDVQYGVGQVLVALTADHGATPVPEQLQEIGFLSARIKKKTLDDAIKKALDSKYGEGDWIVALEDPHIFLNRELMAERNINPEMVRQTAGEAILEIKGFGGYLTRGQLLTGQVPDTMIGRSILKTYYAPRGGDVVAWVLPLHFWGKYGEIDGGSTHGTRYSYDSEVPVLISGPSVRPGRYGVRDQVDFAATLSQLLGIPKPAACEGKVVPIMVE